MLVGMSKAGLAPAVVAAVGLWIGQAFLLHYGRHYLDPSFGRYGIAGGLLLVVAAAATARLVRRADYPWMMLVAAAALPLYEPQNTTDRLPWMRTASVVFGLVLVVAAVYAFLRMVRRTDELERRVNQEALAFAFAVSLVLAVGWSLLQQVLPPLRGIWVATAMIASWLVGWNAAVRRYR
jgi:hypothetical protein